MKIPLMLYGTGKEVHPRAKRFMSKVIKEGTFPEIPPSELFDSDQVIGAGPKPTVMFLPDSRKGSEDHFRAYVFQTYSPVRGGDQMWQDIFVIFDGLVKTDWGMLCLLAGSLFVPSRSRDAERNREFFERLLQVWPHILQRRELFYDQEMIHHGGAYFWQHANSDLWTILVESGGVPISVVQEGVRKRKDDHFVPELIEKYVLA